MRKILAIGGGNIGRDDKRINTTLFDREIIRLTEKKNPNFYLYQLPLQAVIVIVKRYINSLVKN